MKSKAFSKSKTFRSPSKSLQRDVKRIKKKRRKTDRIHTKVVLKKFQNDEKIEYRIKRNDGAWDVV